MSLAESFNDIVFLDVIYYHRIGTPNVQKLYGHLIDDAVRLRLQWHM